MFIEKRCTMSLDMLAAWLEEGNRVSIIVNGVEYVVDRLDLDARTADARYLD